MDAPRIEWNAAEVSDGDLTVPVAGEVPKRLRTAFQTTLALLDSRWDVKLKKSGELRVREVHEGDEDAVRHLLESALQQARATVMGQEPDERPDDSDQAETPEEPEDGDDRMTRRFRGFDTA